MRLVVFLCLVYLSAAVVVQGNDHCIVIDNNSEYPMSMEYLSNIGNVTVVEQDGERIDVGVSFCRQTEYFAGDQSCGRGYLMVYGNECSGLFSSFKDEPHRENQSIMLLLESNSGDIATVDIECTEGVHGLKVIAANVTTKPYGFHFASETVCPGYASQVDEGMLPKAAIIAIVSAIVGVVVVAAVVFQWKSRSRAGDDYAHLA